MTRDALLESGIQLFASQGYEATSTRQIETEAGVQRNLITYHFGNKDDFWKACIAVINSKMAKQLQPAFDQSRDLGPLDRVRYLIRRFVRASAQYPEIGRIIFDEGRSDTWRLRWFAEHYSRGFFDTVEQLFEEARAQGTAPNVPLTSFYYMLVSSTALFTLSAECKLLTGQNPNEASLIEAHADAIAMLLTTNRE
ncbi:MAG: TetR/AcrR family transcriptional regulator [Pseudomonadota bacterium]